MCQGRGIHAMQESGGGLLASRPGQRMLVYHNEDRLFLVKLVL